MLVISFALSTKSIKTSSRTLFFFPIHDKKIDLAFDRLRVHELKILLYEILWNVLGIDVEKLHCQKC